MKEQIYQWMNSLAVFYILFTMLLHLVPGKKYERYVRFFMGLLLILLVATPVFAIVGKSGELMESFGNYYQQEYKRKEQEELENLQALYLKKGYEKELEEKITKNMKVAGIDLAGVKVNIEGERVSVLLYVWEEADEKMIRRMEDELDEIRGTGEGEYQIKVVKHHSQTVDRDPSSGTSSGSGGASRTG